MENTNGHHPYGSQSKWKLDHGCGKPKLVLNNLVDVKNETDEKEKHEWLPVIIMMEVVLQLLRALTFRHKAVQSICRSA